MVAASRATSVPEAPMATPMSSRLRAGASFTPSPVMATVCPSALKASTTCSLVSGLERATISSGVFCNRASSSPWGMASS